MAWSTTTTTSSFIDGNWQFWEYLTISQTASSQAGKIRLNVTSYVKTYGPNAGYTIPSRTLNVASGSTTIASANSAFPARTPGFSFYGDTVTIDIPNAYIGQSLTFNSRLMEFTLTLGGNAAYSLTITKNTGVQSVTVSRSSSPVGATGALSSGAIIYSGDVLSVAAVAVAGYEMDTFSNSITVSGNTTIAPTAKVMGAVWIDSGSGFGMYLIYIDNGSAWEQVAPYIDNGSAWEVLA